MSLRILNKYEHPERLGRLAGILDVVKYAGGLRFLSLQKMKALASLSECEIARLTRLNPSFCMTLSGSILLMHPEYSRYITGKSDMNSECEKRLDTEESRMLDVTLPSPYPKSTVEVDKAHW